MQKNFTFIVIFAVISYTAAGKKWNSHQPHDHNCQHQHEGWHMHENRNFPHGEHNWHQQHHNDNNRGDYDRPHSWDWGNHHHHHPHPNPDWGGHNADSSWSTGRWPTPSAPSPYPPIQTTAFPTATNSYPSPTTEFTTSTTSSTSRAQPNPIPEIPSSSESPIPSTSSQDVKACIQSCSVTKEYQPVCGSDYQTYNNMAHLLCAQGCGVELRIFLRRKCPSPQAPTTAPIVAPAGVTGAAAVKYSKVQCILSCPYTEEDNPVCGSDDVTYDNPSMLLCAQMCGYNVRIKSMSACPNGVNLPTPTSDLFRTTPLPYVSQSCLNSCPSTSENSPVCGTNGFTYQNPSHLKCASLCGIDVEIKWKAPCTQPNNDNNQPAIPSVDEQRQTPLLPNVQLCVLSCPVTDEYQPVCGTNGITYTSPGQLECDQLCGIRVDIRQPSPCFLNTNNIPNNFNNINPVSSTSTTFTVTTTSPLVVACIRSCPQTPEYNPVCGTNGVTYTNPGHLSCAQACGVRVDIKRRSACSQPVVTEQSEANNSPINGADIIPIQQTQLQNVNNGNSASGNKDVSTLPSEVLLSIFTEAPVGSTTEPDEKLDLDERFGEDEKKE